MKKLLPTDLAKWFVKKYIDRPVERNPNYKVKISMCDTTSIVTLLFVCLSGFIIGFAFSLLF